ncbi:MAG TPA: hypothetical protein VHF90_10115 [Thermoleophilaceae bacterium]|nr:hypothetical protein [Thermoleophilaceae bacterium]
MALRNRTLAACALSLALAGGLAACGADHEALGVEEPAREGLAIDIGGLDYNVFITRELNLAITPDKAYYEGPPAKPGNNLFGVFIQVCNRGEETLPSASEFKVTDSQGAEFEPIELPEDNAFAYHPRQLAPEQCIPEDGSVAQQGPTAGSMLLFDFPLENTENRPLELDITSPQTSEHDSETKRFLLDL